jgi:sugar lactone lactonase YvrE
MIRRLLLPVVLMVALLVAGTPTVAAAGEGKFPTRFSLPNGFQPEGIAIGPGPVAYFGSLADGSIYRASLRTGKGKIVADGPGTPSVGLKTDHRGRLFVAGGPAGDARVIDVRTGALLARYALATGDTFINDVVLARGAAWFTDSRQQVLYKLPLGRHGRLPAAAVKIPITGDLVFIDGFNANGIESTPDGRALLVVQSNTGGLFRVDPATGASRKVDLGAETLANGDGLLLCGRTLYAVQNFANVVAVVELNRSGTRGVVTKRVGDRRFDVPTTVASFRDRLYLPNARFTTPPTPTTPYNVVAINRP